jgi:hypothetical protein
MVDDPDIYRAAKLLADQHSEDSPIRASERGDGLLKDGDTGGTLVRRMIVRAIEETQRGRRPGKAVN